MDVNIWIVDSGYMAIWLHGCEYMDGVIAMLSDLLNVAM